MVVIGFTTKYRIGTKSTLRTLLYLVHQPMNGAVCANEDVRDTASSTHKKRTGVVRRKKSKDVKCKNTEEHQPIVSDESVCSNDS